MAARISVRPLVIHTKIKFRLKQHIELTLATNGIFTQSLVRLLSCSFRFLSCRITQCLQEEDPDCLGERLARRVMKVSKAHQDESDHTVYT